MHQKVYHTKKNSRKKCKGHPLPCPQHIVHSYSRTRLVFCYLSCIVVGHAEAKTEYSGKSYPGQLNQGCIFFDLKGFSFVFVCFLGASGLTYIGK